MKEKILRFDFLEKKILAFAFISLLVCLACAVPVKVIAGELRPIPQPVGGEVFLADKLALLTPYIAAILVIATAVMVIVKKRKQ